MADESSQIVAVHMPQANVNDEEATLVAWRVENGQSARKDTPLCEIETSKAVGDVPAPASGVVRHAAAVGDVIAVGEVFAHIGPSMEAIEAYLAQASIAGPSGEGGEPREATAGAIELARRYGIDIQAVEAEGRVRRSDVEKHVAARGLSPQPQSVAQDVSDGEALPAALADRVSSEDLLSDHDWSIARHLERTQSQVTPAHVVMDCPAKALAAWMEAKRQAGQMTGMIPVLLKAAAIAVAAEPKLGAFRLGRRICHYRSIDIGYTARSGDGRLFTPVVRGVDHLSLDQLAVECSKLSMAVFRGEITAGDMTGGCLTVSALSDQPVRFHVGLQNAYQSAILTAGAIHDEVDLSEGLPVAVPTLTLCLSYDHGLMDGWEAASALAEVRAAIAAVSG